MRSFLIVNDFVFIPSTISESTPKQSDVESVLHSSLAYFLVYEPSYQALSHSSFPWRPFTEKTSNLREKSQQTGRAYIFYPAGFLFSAFDDEINENYPLDSVPSLLNFTLNSFQFKQYFIDHGNNILRNIAEQYQKQKNHKKLELQFIGIHNRRTDHLKFQQEAGFIPLDVGYFLEAMEMFRCVKK